MSEQVFQHVRVVGKEFNKAAVSLDNMSYENCKFIDCDLFYSGGPAQLFSCDIRPGNRWHIQGAAALTVETLRTSGFQISSP
jgi:hypothetical protein